MRHLAWLGAGIALWGQLSFAQVPDWADARQTEAYLREQGVLATLVYPPSAREPIPVRVELRFREVLEIARMIVGEVNPRSPSHLTRLSPEEREQYVSELWPHAALVIWTVVNRNFYITNGDANAFRFLDFMQAFSQPINPAWSRNGRFCNPNSSSYVGPNGPCRSSLLRRRDSISHRPWSRMSEAVRAIAMSFAAGRLQNPDPRVVDFARFRRSMCRHPGIQLIHHIWTHGFCGTEDPRGIRVRLVPGAWARQFPNISESLEPFSAH